MLLLLWYSFDNSTYAGMAEWGLLERRSTKAGAPAQHGLVEQPSREVSGGAVERARPALALTEHGPDRGARAALHAAVRQIHTLGDPGVSGRNDAPQVTRTASDQSGLTQRPGPRTYSVATLQCCLPKTGRRMRWSATDRQTGEPESQVTGDQCFF